MKLIQPPDTLTIAEDMFIEWEDNFIEAVRALVSDEASNQSRECNNCGDTAYSTKDNIWICSSCGHH